MKNTALRFGLALGVMSMCLAPVAAQQRFDQLAPEKTLIVVSAPDMGTMMDHIHNGPLGEMWNSPEVQDMLHGMMEQLHQAMNQAAEELDVDEDAFAWPTGSVGASLILAMNDDLGLEMPAILVVADFGENMAKIEPLIEKMLEKAREEGALTDERDVFGRTVHTFKGYEEPPVDPDDPWAQEMGGMENPFAAGMKEIYFARSENHLVLCSNMTALREVFGKLDGEGGPSLADRDVYRNALAQIEGNEMQAVVMLEGIGDVLEGTDPMMMAMMPALIGPMESFGLTKVKALSMGMDFDHEGALMAQSMGIYMPEGKTGLMKLLDLDSAKGELPPFVGPDVTGYTRYNFKFSGMMEVIRQAAANAPEMVQADIEGFLMQMGPMLEQLFNSIGPEIHVVQPASDPQPAGAMNPMMNPMAQFASSMVAIRCTNPDALQNMIGGFAPQMGLQPRDFLGQTIYSDPSGMISIGLGGGFVFVGQGAQVEQALRSTGQQNLPSLKNEPVFKQAMGFLPAGNAVAWGFTDTGRQLKQVFEMMNNMPMGPGMGLGMGEIPDLTPLAKHFGPGVWEIRSTSDGFVVHSYALPPADRN